MLLLLLFNYLIFVIMSKVSNSKTLQIVIKLIIAVASAIAGALGYQTMI